jgi:cytochrome c553
MRKLFLPATVLLLGIVAFAWADEPQAQSRDGARRMVSSRSAPIVQPDDENLQAQHDPTSSSYDDDCLSCHGDVLTEQTQDPRILSYHQAMMPFTPGYNPRHGPSNDVCVQCHRYVELRMDSAGALRKHVDPTMCALCHGPSGPGPVFYER